MPSWRPSILQWSLPSIRLCDSILNFRIDCSGSDFESSNRVSWIAVAYILSNTAFQPLYGRLSDIFGRKPCLLFANIVFLIGTLGCCLAPGLWTLVASRMVAGMGGGGLNVLVLIHSSELIPGHSDIIGPDSIETTGHVSRVHEHCFCLGYLIGRSDWWNHGGCIWLEMVLWNSDSIDHVVHSDCDVLVQITAQ